MGELFTCYVVEHPRKGAQATRSWITTHELNIFTWRVWTRARPAMSDDNRFGYGSLPKNLADRMQPVIDEGAPLPVRRRRHNGPPP